MIMRPTLILLALTLLAVVFIAGAKEPEAGNHVLLSVGNGINFDGNISYIGNGLMCFDNATIIAIAENGSVMKDNLTDFCISTAKIELLRFK